MKSNIKTSLVGSRADGYVLKIENKELKFVYDECFTYEELIAVRDLLNKKLK